MVFEIEILEGGVLRMNCLGSIYGSSLEDSDMLMSKVMDVLIAEKKITGIILAESREYEYDFPQTKLLLEMANAFTAILREKKIVSIKNFGRAGTPCESLFSKWFSWASELATAQLRSDPIGAYVNLTRELRHAKIKAASQECYAFYVSNVLEPLKEALENCSLIQMAKPYLDGYHIGDRSVYREIFHPSVRPNFMYTKYMMQPPEGEAIERYKVGDVDIEIFRIPGKVRCVYHIIPPEFRLTEDEYVLLDQAKRILEERRPREFEMKDQEKMREIFYNIGIELLRDLAEQGGKAVTQEQLERLSSILTRYTAGLGIIEILLADENVQDVYINSPLGTVPCYIYHSKYEECETNLIPSRTDGERWATRFKLMSGRPLDEANPVLDTETSAPGGRARVAAIYPKLSPDGMGFALRRHRDRPWTLPLFLDAKFINPLFAGLLSFVTDYGRTYLIAGTRSSGKSSLLGALMLEIQPRFRVITVEDSVTGDCQIVFERNGKIERKTIGELIDGQIEKYGYERNYEDREVLRKNPENIKVFSLNSCKKFVSSKVKSFIRHKVSKDIFEIETRTGRKIRVTGDHSLFTLNNSKIIPARVKDLKIGDYLVTPRFLSIDNKKVSQINILEHLSKSSGGFFVGEHIRDKIIANWENIKGIAKELGYSRTMTTAWKRNKVLPLEVFNRLQKIGIVFDTKKIQFKYKSNSKPLPIILELDDIFLAFVGLWLADGCYDKKSVITSIVDEELRDIVYSISDRLGIKTKMHSDGISLMLNSATLKYYMEKILGLSGNAYTKRFPEWIYNLSKEQIAMILKGIYSGDGHPSEKETMISLASESLIKDIQTFLLFFGIIGRVRFVERDKTFCCRISTLKGIRTFTEKIGFLQTDNMNKLKRISAKISTHDSTDIIPFQMGFKQTMPDIIPQFNYSDYVTKGYNIGREKLKTMVSDLENDHAPNKTFEQMNLLANSDIFWDEIKLIQKIRTEGYVYDLSVPENENFVCENILAHNTLELPVEQLRELGYNIERMKSRSVITHVETELPSDEAIRTALRLGDSSLMIGEVRSSLRGNEEVVIIDNGETKRIAIKDLEGKEIKGFQVPTLGFDLKMKISKLSGFVKHPERKKLIEITTQTGRKITVTHDHSLFTSTRDFRIAAIECDKLKKGDGIAIPSFIPCGFNDIDSLNLLEMLPKFRVENFEKPVRECIARLGWKKASEICKIKTGDIYNYFRMNQKTNIPAQSFKSLVGSADVEFDPSELFVRRGTSNRIPAIIPVNEDFCRFLGYYVSEGYHTDIEGKGGMVVLTNSDKAMLNDFVNLSKKLFDIEPGLRQVEGAGISTQVRISSAPLAKLISRLGCGRICTEKRIPPIIYGLSKNKIAAFLRGLYSGDGGFTSSIKSGNCVRYFTTSKLLAEDVMYLLLSFGIVATLRKRDVEKGNVLWIVEFKNRKMVETFLNEIGFAQKQPKPIIKAWTHTKSSTIFFDKEYLKKHLTKYPRKYRHLFRFGRCSKEYIEKVVLDKECTVSKRLKEFACGNFFLDKIKEIREIELEKPEPVYDLSVEPSQNFVAGFGGILAHNTEAKALYEAMRIGALANVVAGTIHGDSAYGVFDRVVNDLGVPQTSFKATDLIVICNRLRSADGLHSFRRVTGVTEVRKHWKSDPADEGGFVELMEYSSKSDSLKPSGTLLNGESVILNEIAENVREWAGNWGAVWDNINLRGKIAQSIVEIANGANRNLMEAGTVMDSNQMFHMLSERSKNENGFIDTERVYAEWLEWFRKKAKGS